MTQPSAIARERGQMARAIRWLALMLAPLLLGSCLLAPTRFTATLDVRADRSFTFAYAGEVYVPRIDRNALANEMGGSDDPDQDEQNWQQDGDGPAALLNIAAKEDDFSADDADDGDDDARMAAIAEALSREYGYRSARYLGQHRFAIDYRISGRLNHGFVFPFNPDAQAIIPFLTIELRGADRVRIRAPAFANDDAGLAGMSGITGSADDTPGTMLDGTFTITTDAAIVSQNQEDGAQAQPDGAKRIVWKVTPTTRDAPMAVLRLTPLP